MFKSCCARPNKKISKSKSKPDNMDSSAESDTKQAAEVVKIDLVASEKVECSASITKTVSKNNMESVKTSSEEITASKETKISEGIDSKETKKSEEINSKETKTSEQINSKETKTSEEIDDVQSKDSDSRDATNGSEYNDASVENTDTEDIPHEHSKVTFTEPETSDGDNLDLTIIKKELAKKRFSVDYKRSRLDFKRFSVDCRRDSATLEELARLEKELAKTNFDVRPGGRRKSTGILKSTASSSNDLSEQKPYKPDSDDDEVFEESVPVGDSGTREPPATPIGRDELALRRHRFFSDLVSAARAAIEHRVRFDPLGPVVAEQGTDAEAALLVVSPAAELEALIERLERVTSRLERLHLPDPSTPAPTPASAHSPPPFDVPPPVFSDNMSVNGYQDIVQGPLRTYLQLSAQIGGDVAAHADLVNKAFQAQMSYIQLATTRAKPSQAEESQLLAPTSEKINAIQQFREKNRTSPFFNHLSAISESIPALGWVAVSPTPAPYVKEMNDAGQFYTNRVLKEWKEKDKKHVEWCRTWVQLLSDLQAYVKQHHTTGLVWSGKGSGAGVPPPPPGGLPPPPMPEVDFSNLSLDDRSALFAQINQGENITSNLKRVTADMQTHKNPALRSGPAPFKAGQHAPAKALPQPGAGQFDKPPVFARDGKKWIIEYQRGNQNLLVEGADMNNVVYMFRCRDSALIVKGKVNGIILDSCTKCAVVFDNLVSSVEFVNCQSVQMQVLGKVPTVSVDKTDGCQIYLSKDSLDVEIVSSKSSEMNVLVPKANGDYTEYPVPEQFKTVLNKPQTGLTTTPVENKG